MRDTTFAKAQEIYANCANFEEDENEVEEEDEDVEKPAEAPRGGTRRTGNPQNPDVLQAGGTQAESKGGIENSTWMKTEAERTCL